MSEDRSRFRIKKGDLEIEYEGKSTEVSSRYKEVFEWIKTFISTVPEPLIKEEQKEKEPKKRKGGPRSSVISSAIDDLIEEGFFDDWKNSSQVLEELKRKTVPVSGIQSVINALKRRVPKKLERIKNERGLWVYRKKQ